MRENVDTNVDRNVSVARKHIKICKRWENKMKQNVCMVVGKIHVKGMTLSKVKRANKDLNRKDHDHFH